MDTITTNVLTVWAPIVISIGALIISLAAFREGQRKESHDRGVLTAEKLTQVKTILFATKRNVAAQRDAYERAVANCMTCKHCPKVTIEAQRNAIDVFEKAVQVVLETSDSSDAIGLERLFPYAENVLKLSEQPILICKDRLDMVMCAHYATIEGGNLAKCEGYAAKEKMITA
jgi:transcription elongation factor Elf1